MTKLFDSTCVSAFILEVMQPVDGSQRAEALRALALDDVALLSECVEQFFNAGGPGGQHQNKAETAVRLRHLKTGVTVTATERRSQAMNRGEALERLRRALKALTYVAARRIPTRATRASKRRRIENKRRQSDKKRDRKGDW